MDLLIVERVSRLGCRPELLESIKEGLEDTAKGFKAAYFLREVAQYLSYVQKASFDPRGDRNCLQ